MDDQLNAICSIKEYFGDDQISDADVGVGAITTQEVFTGLGPNLSPKCLCVCVL